MYEPFHLRFNIDVPDREAQRRFLNRIENSAREAIREIYSRGGYEMLDRFMIVVETSVGEPHETAYLESSWIERWRKLVKNDFIKCLQAAEGFYGELNRRYPDIGRRFSDSLSRALSISEVDLGLSWDNGMFIRKGAGPLNEVLVNDPLRWLADPKYQNVLVPFKKGLSHFLEGEKSPERLADAVTDMYEALEATAKIVTERLTKDLSGNRELFISTLDLSEPYKKMLKEYIDYANDFRHATDGTTPRQWPSLKETEAFVYLTGLFIRLAIQPKQS